MASDKRKSPFAAAATTKRQRGPDEADDDEAAAAAAPHQAPAVARLAPAAPAAAIHAPAVGAAPTVNADLEALRQAAGAVATAIRAVTASAAEGAGIDGSDAAMGQL